MSTPLVLNEICYRLGEARFKEMFHSLNALMMKKLLTETGIPAVRLPGHTSTRKRNEDWASRLWRAMPAVKPGVCLVLLAEWLKKHRREMLVAFLDDLGVPHQDGLTEQDFLKETPEDKLHAAAQRLLTDGRFQPGEVAAYLLFLDGHNQTDKFAPLHLEQYLGGEPGRAVS